MKKACFILGVVLILSSIGFSRAENMDISSLSYEELVELNNRIQIVLFSQALIDGVSIPNGKYVESIDIPKGSYVLSVTCEEESYVVLEVYNQADERLSVDVLERNGESVKITLDDGMYFTLKDDSEKKADVKLQTFSGLFNK